MVKYLNGATSLIMSFDDPGLHIFENVFVRAGLILVYSFIFLICFFGNLAVILVVSLRWKRRSASKFCLGNMAVANFSVSVFCILQNLTLYLTDTWVFGEMMCKVYQFITNLCHAASVLMVVLISMERYLVLLHPIRCRQFLTTRTLVLVVLAVWVISAVISIPCFFYFGLVPIQLNDNGDFGQICAPMESPYNSFTVDTIYFLLMYLLPLFVMSAMYLRIGLFLRQRERLTRGLDEESAGVQDTAPAIVEENRQAPELNSAEQNMKAVKNELIQEEIVVGVRSCEVSRYVRGGSMEEISGSRSTTASSSIFQRRTAVAINPEALRLLYRYKRLRLSHARCKQRQRVVRILVYIIATFALLNLPHHLRKLCLHFLPSFDMKSEANNLIAPLTFALMYANCAINPILYAFMSKSFRASLRELLCFGYGRSIDTV